MVDNDFILREDTYNLRCGGIGGWEHINTRRTNSERSRIGKLGQQAIKNKGVNIYSKNYISPFANRDIHTELVRRSVLPEVICRRKKTFASIGHQQGNKNSQFGTVWISKEKSIKKIKKDNYSFYEELGWTKRRK